ncbi:MAG: uncharacterized protein QOG64_2637, partial [Acidimicrobiaceae bacterium]|nr:uncharacterized protein [Acidimicrobiaceae bacterium]
DGFLAEICRAWEAATAPAEAAGVRVVHLRTGLVLSPEGGVLKPLLTPFKLGLGGRLGTGRQYWSWITIDDAVAGIIHAIEHDSVGGALNLTAPEPAPQLMFAKALGHALHRPTVLPTPKFAVQARLGKEAAAEMTLAGQRAIPAKLESTGYRFLHPQLGEALDTLLA